MASKKYRDALVRALDDAKIATDASPGEMIASLMKASSNAVTFSDEDLPLEGRSKIAPVYTSSSQVKKDLVCYGG